MHSKMLAPLLESEDDTKARFDRVSDLVEGFGSPFGLELLSTVHWITNEERTRSLDDAIERTHAWNTSKKQFSPRHIDLAINVLRKAAGE